MSDRKEISLIAGMFVIAGIGAALLASPDADAGPPSTNDGKMTPTVRMTCQEDEPCWNPTMGDGNGQMVCTVTAIKGDVYLSDCYPMEKA